jgi:hypothetical protein
MHSGHNNVKETVDLAGTTAITAERTNMTNGEIIRIYYSGFEKKEWNLVEQLLADGFTFTSPNDDDHIDMRTFKEKCWPPVEWVEQFEIESLIGQGDDAFAKYLCRTKDGRSFGTRSISESLKGRSVPLNATLAEARGIRRRALRVQRLLSLSLLPQSSL